MISFLEKIDYDDIWYNRTDDWVIRSIEHYCRDPFMMNVILSAKQDREWDGIYKVYGLVHPISKDLYYIGQTKYLMNRFISHYEEPHNNGLKHIMRGLWSIGAVPIIFRFYETEYYDDALLEEKRLIEKYSKRCLLMNIEHIYPTIYDLP